MVVRQFSALDCSEARGDIAEIPSSKFQRNSKNQTFDATRKKYLKKNGENPPRGITRKRGCGKRER
jgi:hypothetical protein